MNTDLLARTTFVLDRSTRDQLAYISRRLKVSQSSLVRDVLTEPVSLMAKWVQSLPDEPSQADAEAAAEVMQDDLVAFIERQAERVKGDGHE